MKFNDTTCHYEFGSTTTEQEIIMQRAQDRNRFGGKCRESKNRTSFNILIITKSVAIYTYDCVLDVTGSKCT